MHALHLQYTVCTMCTNSYSFVIGLSLYIINETLEGDLTHRTLVTDLRPLDYTHITECIY